MCRCKVVGPRWLLSDHVSLLSAREVRWFRTAQAHLRTALMEASNPQVKTIPRMTWGEQRKKFALIKTALVGAAKIGSSCAPAWPNAGWRAILECRANLRR